LKYLFQHKTNRLEITKQKEQQFIIRMTSVITVNRNQLNYELVNRNKKKSNQLILQQQQQHQKLNQKSTKNYQFNINLAFFYKLILDFILNCILLYRYISVNVLKIIYLCKISINTNNSNNNNNQKLDFPKHVLVILNENINNDQHILRTFDTIAQFFFSSASNTTVTFYQFKDIATEVKENLLLKYKVNIQFYSYSQIGRGLFKQTCRNIASDVLNENLKLSDVNKDLIDNYFTGYFFVFLFDNFVYLIILFIFDLEILPEPQLVINIGANDSLAGFSPWHLRLSEIM